MPVPLSKTVGLKSRKLYDEDANANLKAAEQQATSWRELCHRHEASEILNVDGTVLN